MKEGVYVRITGYVESVQMLPSDGNQKPLNCIMIDGVPIMAQSDVPLNFAVGDEVDIAVRVTGRRLDLKSGGDKVFRTFWFSALVRGSGNSPKVQHVNGNGYHADAVLP